VNREILPSVEHRQSRYFDNQAEMWHRPTRLRERQIKRFKSVPQAQRFLSTHSRIHGHFPLRCRRLTSNQYRAARNLAFRAWHKIIEVSTANRTDATRDRFVIDLGRQPDSVRVTLPRCFREM
jgi:putative transposase